MVITYHEGTRVFEMLGGEALARSRMNEKGNKRGEIFKIVEFNEFVNY